MLKRTRHAVYRLNYHFVWCPKYRRAVLTGKVSDRLVVLLHQIIKDIDGKIIELAVRPDHVHLFGSFPPDIAPYQIAHFLKGTTSRMLRNEFPSLKSRLPSLWTRSYYVGSAGNVSSETIRKYIESQENV